MNFTIEILNEKIEVKVIKKRTTRNTYLRFRNVDLIEISTNIFFTKTDAKHLLENKREWLEKGLLKLKKKTLPSNKYYYLGEIYDMGNIQIDLDSFYKQKCSELIPRLVDKYSKQMNLYPTKIKYRKNKRTWGSCNSKNVLNFNIYLIKYPLEIVEYVVIHELAHIEHKNHSKNFWDLVKRHCDNYKQREKLFKSLL